MPANDVQTNLTIALQTKGFEKGLRELLKVNTAGLDNIKKSSDAWDKAKTTIKDMEKQVRSLAKEQIDAQKAMAASQDKSGDEYKKQEERLKRARDATKLLRQEIKLLVDTNRDNARAQQELQRGTDKLIDQQRRMREAGRWAGTQGFMQGAGLGGMAGMFMQRGPGFWRQAAGQQLGGMFRRAGGAAQGLAFGGIGGLQQALSAVPGGGILGGQLGAVAGHSGQALGYQRARLGASPFIGGADPAEVARAQARVAAMGPRPTRKQLEKRGFSPKSVLEKQLSGPIRGTKDFVTRLGMDLATGVLGMSKEEGLEYGLEQLGEMGIITPKQAKDLKSTAVSGVTAEQRKFDTERSRRQRGVVAAREGPMSGLGGMGRNLAGIGKQETLQRVAALFQTAGGQYTGTGGQQEQVRAALAAQTMFGVGTETSGSFLQAGRRGGLVGGRGQGAEALTGALGDAMAMGLEGSEITQYLQTVAQGIQSFQQTGIPFNKESIKSMTVEMGKAGIGGVRGTAMAGGLQRYIQGIGQRGITGGMDLMMMQAFGGFQGGGAGDFEQSILQMESMKGTGPGGIEAGTPMGKMISRLVEMGGGAKGGGVTFMRKALGKTGMQMSMGEAMSLAERVTGQQLLTPDQREAFGVNQAAEAERMGAGAQAGQKIQTVDQLVAAAAKRVTDLGPNLRKQASIMDRQLEVGTKALKAVQNLEKSSLDLNESFMFLAGPTLNDFSASMSEVTGELSKLLKEEGGLLGAVRKMILGV